jgi:flagellar L-ring protein precursor FlgH
MRREMRHLLLLLLCASGLPAASMWTSETLADGSLYADQVARKRGDLITILVKETVTITDKQTTNTSRKSDPIKAQISLVPGTTQLPATQGSSTVDTLPAIGASSENTFKGDGSYTASGDVRATITGRVVDVLDNGNLLVEGRRQIQVNDDSKTILVTGIVRTADLKSDNTILSEKLHNFQVSIEGEGPLARSQQKGWVGKIVDVLWPF